MMNFTKWILAPALATGLMLIGNSSTASAQNGCYGNGFGSGYGGYSNPYYGLRSSYSSIRDYHTQRVVSQRQQLRQPPPRQQPPRPRKPSHWGYHPAQVAPYGNAYGVIPGHHNYHQNGYWHY